MARSSPRARTGPHCGCSERPQASSVCDPVPRHRYQGLVHACGSSRGTWAAPRYFSAIRPRRRAPSHHLVSNICTWSTSMGLLPASGQQGRGRASHRSDKVPLQLGGGIRNLGTIESWLQRGVTRVIIGTAAVRDPTLVRQAARLYPGRVAVALDARDGRVAVEGWAEASELSAFELARQFEDAGIAALIYTDVSRDGMLAGLNLDAAIALSEACEGSSHRIGGARLHCRRRGANAAACQKARRRHCRAARCTTVRLDPAEALRLIRSVPATA